MYRNFDLCYNVVYTDHRHILTQGMCFSQVYTDPRHIMNDARHVLIPGVY